MATDAGLERITTDNAPAPAGHYSQAVRAGSHLYISGQLPIRADGSHPVDAGFEEQARQALANMLAILAAAGAGPRHLARVAVYIVGIEHWQRFNAIYAEMLPGARPARSVVPVPALHYGFLVEVDAVAFLADAAGDATGSIP